MPFERNAEPPGRPAGSLTVRAKGEGYASLIRRPCGLLSGFGGVCDAGACAGRRRAVAAYTATAGLQGQPTVASVEHTPSFEGQRRRAMHEAPSSRFIARLPLANGVPRF